MYELAYSVHVHKSFVHMYSKHIARCSEQFNEMVTRKHHKSTAADLI